MKDPPKKRGSTLYFPGFFFWISKSPVTWNPTWEKNIPIEIDRLKSALRSYLISLPTFWFRPKTEALQNVFESGPVAANRAGSHVKRCENELHPDSPDDSKKRGPCSTNRRYGNRSRFRIDGPELVGVHRCPVIFGMTPSDCTASQRYWPLAFASATFDSKTPHPAESSACKVSSKTLSCAMASASCVCSSCACHHQRSLLIWEALCLWPMASAALHREAALGPSGPDRPDRPDLVSPIFFHPFFSNCSCF